MHRLLIVLTTVALAGCTTTDPNSHEVMVRLRALSYLPDASFGLPDGGVRAAAAMTSQERAAVDEIKRTGFYHPQLFISVGPQPDVRGVVTIRHGGKVAVRLVDAPPPSLPASFCMAIYSPSQGYKCDVFVQDRVGRYVLGSLRRRADDASVPVLVGDHAACGACLYNAVQLHDADR